MAHLQTLSSVLGVLTALIAPALLVSACGTFIISTATRLTRNVDQIRMFGAELRQLHSRRAPAEEIAQAARQLARMFRRVMQEQRALTLFYAAAVLFVACSLALGLEALVQFLPNAAGGEQRRSAVEQIATARGAAAPWRIAPSAAG